MLLPGEIAVDLFAGGGGASLGLEAAIGRPVDIAINHSRAAIAMHRQNHPQTRHYCEDIFQVDPREACAGRRVGILWASPDCTHHSRARGKGKPRSKNRRALADVVVRWARAVKPRVILLENVEEFEDWGPLDDEGYPIEGREGEDFRRWLAELTDCGYRVAYRTIVAADHGSPTTRKRLFLIARSDGGPLVWPDATHGKGRPSQWRAAAEIIDWSDLGHSIFLTTAEGKALGVKRPLADATLRRIAAGVRRYVLGSVNPFVIPLTHQGDARANTVAEPLRTVTAANRGELALVAPMLAQTGYGERQGQAPRALDINRPLGTVVACGAKHALVAPVMVKNYGGPNGHMTPGSSPRAPLGTITTRDHGALGAVFLSKLYGTSTGSDVGSPVPTVTAGGNHLAACTAFLMQYNGQSIGAHPEEPLNTITTHDRFGVVTVFGETYRIVDIRMRMLKPRELFRAQDFPDNYEIDECDGLRLTKTQQIELAGNSVCGKVAAALVAANVGRVPRPAPRQLTLFGRAA